MIRLKTLGGADLRHDDGREIRPLLTQPKRLALLVYLCRARGFSRRDTIVGLFWPELDEAHARSSLRQSLTFLRRAMGDGVVVTRGEDEIGVDRTLISCDATEFLEACAANRNDDALRIYGGDFLDGFYISDAASEFQTWMENERAALRRSAATAAWAAADAARVDGDRRTAVAQARRAAAFAADDEGEVARLIAFLDDVGDRAGAIATYEDFANRLRREYDVDPAPETQSVIRRIRARTEASDATVSSSAASPQNGGDSSGRDRSASLRAASHQRSRRPLVYLAAAGTVALAGYLTAFAKRRTESDWSRHTVAVLPFKDLDNDTTRRYVADGVTDQLITDLSQSGMVRVINTRTMLFYRDSMLAPGVAGPLNADAIVHGTIQQSDDSVQVAVELDRADGKEQWKRVFFGTRSDILRIQRDVARALTLEIRGAVGPAQQVALGSAPLKSDAVDLYVRGRFAWNQRGRLNLLKSIDLFTQSLESDPTYAPAYSGMADAYVQLGYQSLLAPSDAFPKAEAAARRALDLDSTLAEPHATLGFVNMYYRWDWAAADREFRRAIAMNPSYATGHEWYGLYLTAMGRFAEALANEREAQKLDPLSVAIAGTTGWVLYYSGRQDDAQRELNVALRMSPAFSLGHFYLGRVLEARGQTDSALAEYSATGPLRNWIPTVAAEGYVFGTLGKTTEARQMLARMDSLSRGEYVTSYAVALVHAALREPDSAFAWLQRGVEERTHWLVWLNRDVRWAPIRADPRFHQLVKQVGLPP
jgi:DNA-binding SARP family transcriptional activator/TolB-like protein/Tfp pilus assembly protein PilF